MPSRYTSLSQHESGKTFDISKVQTYCPYTHEPLVAGYMLQDTNHIKKDLPHREHTMWRYREMLPLFDDQFVVSLGEGYTPIRPLSRLATKYHFHQLLLKDEQYNPTGSFKARGLGMAVSKAFELGVREFCIPTAGNAGSALAAYCAKAGLKAHIFMPKQTPLVFQLDCKIMGAEVYLVDGSIADAGKAMRETMPEDGSWFDVSTLKEPFRLEGKKTMGYEIAEQLNWELPDVIIYPTGGGTGLIGIWKAFHEMLEMGWIQSIPTRMVAVQTVGCDPIVQAFQRGDKSSVPYVDPAVTIANGLRVPHAFGHKLILKAIYDSKGTALSVSEQAMFDGIHEVADQEGVFLSPEGAAVWHACKSLKTMGWITENEMVVLLNTGSGYKYAENLF